MTWASRNVRWALTAYCMLAVLILGGVTWGTNLSVKLAELQQRQADVIHENDHDNMVTSAAQRIENFFSTILLTETSRPYWDYSPYSYSSVYRQDGTKVVGEDFMRPSPLIVQELDPWARLHFQVDLGGGWQSPQVPTGERFSAGAEIARVDPAVGMQAAATLARLQQRVTYHGLAAQLDVYSQWANGADGSINDPDQCIGTVCLRPKNQEYRLRAEILRQRQFRVLPPDLCESRGNILDHSTFDDPNDPFVGLTVSPMSAVWLDEDELGRPQLALLRTLTTDVQRLGAIQGVLLDWELLKQQLVQEVRRDLPEGADLVPVRSEDAEEHKWLLATLPAAILVAPAVQGSLSRTSTYGLIGFVWAAAVAILGGVGLGIRNVLALAERRTQFAYAVTHELRTPLTTLRLYSDMLAGGLVRPADRDRYVQTMNTESERLSDLVDEVLEYARVENHKVSLDIQPVTVAELLDSVRVQCEVRCEKAGKKLTIDVNGLSETTVHTDPQLVRQVVSNLVDNACKHSRDAQDPTITVRATPQHGHRLSIDVEDCGPGVDPRQRHLVFRPFRRGRDHDKQRPGGIGLGLALARSWSRLLNGKLELVQNDPHAAGACFRLTIPASR